MGKLHHLTLDLRLPSSMPHNQARKAAGLKDVIGAIRVSRSAVDSDDWVKTEVADLRRLKRPPKISRQTYLTRL